MALTDKVVGTPGNFVGLANFAKLLRSEIFHQAAWNTVIFTIAATVIKAVFGMWLAILLNRKFRLARFTRATVLLPFHRADGAQRPGVAVDVRRHVQASSTGC